MESLILAAYLFMATFTFLLWLVTPFKSNKIEANDEKSTVAKEVLSIENSMTEEKLNSFKHIESLKYQFESESIIEEVNIKERSEHSLPDLDNQQLEIDITQLKVYKLHGDRCIKITDLPETIQLPLSIKRYKLRGEEVVKVSHIEPYFTY